MELSKIFFMKGHLSLIDQNSIMIDNDFNY